MLNLIYWYWKITSIEYSTFLRASVFEGTVFSSFLTYKNTQAVLHLPWNTFNGISIVDTVWIYSIYPSHETIQSESVNQEIQPKVIAGYCCLHFVSTFTSWKVCHRYSRETWIVRTLIFNLVYHCMLYVILHLFYCSMLLVFTVIVIATPTFHLQHPEPWPVSHQVATIIMTISTALIHYI